MKNQFKKWGRIILIFVLIVSAITLIAHKQFVKADSPTAVIDGVKVNKSSKQNLYDLNNQISATYYTTPTGGYVIYDNRNNVVEYSKKFKGYVKKSSKQYYLGPFKYFQKNGNKYVHSVTNATMNYNSLYNDQLCYENISSIEDNYSGNNSDNNTVITCAAPTNNRVTTSNTSVATGWEPFVLEEEFEERTLSNELALKTKTPALDTNHPTDSLGNCGSTAAAIVCLYHYQNNEYNFASISWANHTNTPSTDGWQAFTNYFISIIEPDGQGSTITSLTEGLNTHLATQKASARYKYSKVASIREVLGYNTVQKDVENSLEKNYPTILGLYKEPTYGNHWVVSEGIRTYKVNDKEKIYYVVNDGWGNNGVEIAKNYIDCTIYRYK